MGSMGHKLPIGHKRIEVCRTDFGDGGICIRRAGHDGGHSSDFSVDYPIEAYPYVLTQTVRMEATGEAAGPPPS